MTAVSVLIIVLLLFCLYRAVVNHGDSEHMLLWLMLAVVLFLMILPGLVPNL